MDSQDPLWDIYFTYIDDTITFHYLFDDSHESHLYPLIQALKAGWIELDAGGNPFVNVENLSTPAREQWGSFFKTYGSADRRKRPHGEAREIEERFQKLTGTTPIDLLENADELQHFLERGYKLNQLLTR